MNQATEWANKAIEFDRAGKAEAAINFYGASAEVILKEIEAGRLDKSMRATAQNYIQRAEFLQQQQAGLADKSSGKNKDQCDLERADFLLRQAMDLDEAGKAKEAIELYTEAVQLCLETKQKTSDSHLQSQLKVLAEQALGRAESLKGVDFSSNLLLNLPSVPDDDEAFLLPSPESQSPQRSVSPNTRRKLAGSAQLSKEELAVLRRTSHINGREYVPFMQVDLREKFAFPVPFSDKDGLLALSAKQKSRLKQWARPEDYLSKPTVIEKVDSGTIKQTVVSDCSFVASLAIAARYERKTGKKLVTSLIYPQNKAGQPVLNPCGKYMVKLHLNGVSRKVIIDDLLPLGQHGELLCSYSQNRNELWVSLLEKAYMKVMGGYDFPGSNSNIDLHALTGWVPERISIRPGSSEFNKDEVFEKILTRYHKGDCLVTLATGQMSQPEQDRAGLVETHAYAMLDIRKVLGRRMFLLKNPWNHLRWKGRYSERDVESWPADLQKALNYNPNDAQQFDDGVFWIDYDSVCHFFDVFYLNWDRSLFPYTYCIHSSWSAGQGPVKDLYSIASNPQYSLEVEVASSAAVWILLSRHITDKLDFANNKEYITVLVYKGGKKIYYPFDPPPYIDGTRINSPHYLCKMVLNSPGKHRFTLAVAQYEKFNTIDYTLRVYTTVPFRLSKLQDAYKIFKKETGEWKGKSAGGCANNRESYDHNPAYQLSLDSTFGEYDLRIELRGPKQFSVGFEIVQVSSQNNKAFARTSSGSYRPGYTVLVLEDVPAGVYNLVPTTFLPGQEGPFILDFASTSTFSVKRLQ